MVYKLLKAGTPAQAKTCLEHGARIVVHDYFQPQEEGKDLVDIFTNHSIQLAADKYPDMVMELARREREDVLSTRGIEYYSYMLLHEHLVAQLLFHNPDRGAIAFDLINCGFRGPIDRNSDGVLKKIHAAVMSNLPSALEHLSLNAVRIITEFLDIDQIYPPRGLDSLFFKRSSFTFKKNTMTRYRPFLRQTPLPEVLQDIVEEYFLPGDSLVNAIEELNHTLGEDVISMCREALTASTRTDQNVYREGDCHMANEAVAGLVAAHYITGCDLKMTWHGPNSVDGAALMNVMDTLGIVFTWEWPEFVADSPTRGVSIRVNASNETSDVLEPETWYVQTTQFKNPDNRWHQRLLVNRPVVVPDRGTKKRKRLSEI